MLDQNPERSTLEEKDYLDLGEDFAQKKETSSVSSLRKFIWNPRVRRFTLPVISLIGGAGYLLSQLPFSGSEAYAAKQPQSTPSPRPDASLSGEMSSLKQGLAEREETWPDNPIEFTDNLGRKRKWEFDNARWGIPPNETNRRVGTVDDYINSAYSRSFQPHTLKYPEISMGRGVAVVVGGVLAEPVNRRFYMITAVNDSTGRHYYPRLEIGADLNNPTDYTDEARKVYLDGLPQGGTAGDGLSSMKLGTDEKGKYLEIVIKNSVIATENGPYRMYLDSNGYPKGGFVKITDPVLDKKVYIPIVSSNSSK